MTLDSKLENTKAVIRFFVPVKKKSFAGTIVLVTGAGHGIGKELAMKFSEVGARLILWDINKRQVEEVEQTIRKSRHKDDAAKSYVCDVSKVENIKATAAKMRREVGEVEVLVNNAGILHGGSLLEILWPSKFKENPNELMYKGINPQYKERND
ncbi:DHB11-like protein [Mya arenaria]|uniref:DHB11-like protein n=1 Tax=Mya arenaria TaxID=6604 RepID=A0ABY7F5X6_MYAAR|nr:DHB11-like protein [Mya arenaria]WAR16204.1 DHB11-like protein [Mya arenaria]